MNTQSGKLVTGLPAMSANALYIVDHPSATVQRSAAKLHRKQIPLCRFHHLEIEKGKYYPMDPDFLKEVLRTNAPAHIQDPLRGWFFTLLKTLKKKHRAARRAAFFPQPAVMRIFGHFVTQKSIF